MNWIKSMPDRKVRLSEYDPDDLGEFTDREAEAKENFADLRAKLIDYQEILFAENKQRLLIVLQAMDTGGKDGAIRHVFEGVNPQGVRVANFKVPSAEELAHDYLWRVHKQVPGKGEIVIFNRSHYEDVLVVRVHQLVPKQVWEKRYDQINAFEKMLHEEGTTILKFYLHINKEEQKQRLQARLDDPEKHWKFNPDDLKERLLWKDYEEAYEDVLEKTSTEWAPWFIIPSNHKWYRNLVITKIIVQALEEMKLQFPQATFNPGEIKIE